MNSQNNITAEEWSLIETFLEIEAISDKEVFYNVNLSTIPTIEEKIRHVKKVNEEIEDSIRLSKIKEFQNQIPVHDAVAAMRQNKKSTSKAIWYAMAAILVVLFGIFWMMKSTNSNKKIFATHFKADPGLRTVMSANSNYTFYEGMVAYKRKEYTEAITMWQQLLPEKEDNDTLHYFLGVAFLAEGNAEKSLEYLEPAKIFSKGVFMEDAVHYTALAKIKTGQLEEAKLLLRKYPSDRNNALLEDLTP